MATVEPAAVWPGVTLVSVGTAAVIVKLKEFPGPAPFTTCSVAAPGAVPAGTMKHAWVSLHKEGLRLTPFKVIVPVALPNPVPVAHWVPLGATGSHCTDVTCGAPTMVKLPDTVTPMTVTSTEYSPPGEIPAGTVATICVSLQLTMPKLCPRSRAKLLP